ncbi:MAG: hypothetical protein WDN23_13420 [Edaphobacter sp.]
MFWQGFLFSLGFASGCFVFTVFFIGTAVAIEQLSELFKKPRKMNGTINIRQWQEQKIVAKNRRDHSPERRA